MGIETYLRLFERVNESVWPWHVVALLGTMIVIVLLHRGQQRLIWLVLAIQWGVVAWVFHHTFFAELNWAAIYFAWGFGFQALLFLGLAVSRKSLQPPANASLQSAVAWVFLSIAVVGYPLLLLANEQTWSSIEMVGIAPDPTCLATLGVLILLRRCAWWLMLVPLSWCAISGAIAFALNLESGYLLAICGLLSLCLLILPNSIRESAFFDKSA